MRYRRIPDHERIWIHRPATDATASEIEAMAMQINEIGVAAEALQTRYNRATRRRDRESTELRVGRV